jgi:hypothetical protein
MQDRVWSANACLARCAMRCIDAAFPDAFCIDLAAVRRAAAV